MAGGRPRIVRGDFQPKTLHPGELVAEAAGVFGLPRFEDHVASQQSTVFRQEAERQFFNPFLT